MKRIIAIVLFTCLCLVAMAQTEFDFGLMHCFLPQKGETPSRAVLICPGGGYEMRCTYEEGTYFKDFFNSRGIACFVLDYRLPGGDKSIPLGDAREALGQIRAHAGEWNINPQAVGIMGFSAGGHLASSIATHLPASERPAFQILFYPVISMNHKDSHYGSCLNFLGKERLGSKKDIREWSNHLHADSACPRAIIFAADDDNVVPVAPNTLAYAKALADCGCSVNLHIFPYGGHGYGLYIGNREREQQILMYLDEWLSLLP